MLILIKEVLSLALWFGLSSGVLMSGIPQQGDQQEDPAVVLEQARIQEKVERDYVEALRLFKTVEFSAEQFYTGERALELMDDAQLGSARCLMKLGRYDEAGVMLTTMLGRGGLMEETRNKAEQLQASINRLAEPDRLEHFSSVDHLAWQLLDAAAGVDENRAKAARSELFSMGSLAAPVLKEIVKDSDYFRSVTAFMTLSRLKDQEIRDFLMTCARNPDPAFRKRCLDGFTSLGYIQGENLPIFRLFLEDEIESLQTSAYSSFKEMIETGEILAYSKDHAAEVMDILCNLHAGKNPFQQAGAWRTIFSVIDKYREKSKPFLPHPGVSKVVEAELAREEGKGLFSTQLEKAVIAAYLLGTEYGDNPLLERVSRIWFADYEDTGRRGKILEYAYSASIALGPEYHAKIAGETVDEKNPARSCDFFLFSFVGKDAFLALPENILKAILAGWASTAEDDVSWRGYKEHVWSPVQWAVIVESLMKNPNDHVRRKVLTYLTECPEPNGSPCLDAFASWAAHPDIDTRLDCIRNISKLVKGRKMDPGPSAALKVLRKSIETLGEPIEVHYLSSKNRHHFTPTYLEYSFGTLASCLEYGADRDAVQAMLLDLNSPRLLDACMLERDLMVPLIRDDPEFLLTLWSRLSPMGKELLFGNVLDPLHMKIDGDTLLILIKQEPLAAWCGSFGLGSAIQLMSRLTNRAGEFPDQIREVTELYFQTPRLHGNSVWTSNVVGLIMSLPPHSETRLLIISRWFKKMDAQSASRITRNYLAETIMASSRNLNQALEWLKEDYDYNFKHKVIGQIFDYADQYLSLILSADLGGRLISIWPQLDDTLRAYILLEMSSDEDLLHAYSGFLIHVMADPSNRSDLRHLAYAELMLTGADEAVQPLLTYLAGLAPGEGDGILNTPEEDDSDVLARTSRLLRDYVVWHTAPASISGFNAFKKFSRTSRKALCLGILGLPEKHKLLMWRAADLVTLGNDDDLAAALEIYRKSSDEMIRGQLYPTILEYRLSLDLPGKEVAGGPILSDEAQALLEEGLEGDCYYHALDLIAKYSLDGFLSKVGELAVGSTESSVRWDAVKCLSQFRNREIVPYLVECLNDNSSSVQDEAKQILDRMREYEEQKALWGDLLDGGGVPGADNPGKALVEMLDHADLEVRLAAIKSLGKLGEPNTLPVLVNLMANGSGEEKAAAKAAIDAITETELQK